MSAAAGYVFKALLAIAAAAACIILLNSSFDIYNDFAYDKAIVKDSPYGHTPLLLNVNNYSSTSRFVKSGDYVYVEDWLAAHNGKIAFSRVRSKFDWGYINREMLVEANINVLPVISSLILLLITFFSVKNLIKKFIL
jgi:hypothetical protein